MRRGSLKPRALLAAAATLLTVGALDSGVARADTLSISVQPSSLVWTSADETATDIMSTWPTVTVSGTAAVQYLQVIATVQQTGACGDTTDTGYTLINGEIQQGADGSFTTSARLQVGDPGPSGPATYLICAWITRQDGSKFGPATDTLAVRRPQASLNFASVSATPGVIHFRALYSLETGAAHLDVLAYDDRQGTKTCPGEQALVPNSLFALNQVPIGGNQPLSGQITGHAGGPGFGGILLAPGHWRLCGYLTYSGLGAIASNISGVLALGSATVVVPPVPRSSCVVPNLKGLTLGPARKLLKQNRCTLGAVKSRKRHHRKGGRVTSQSAPFGMVLGPGGRVNVVLSG